VIESSAAGVLLDIEGTTSSVSFVYDVMFPHARRELDAYLAAHWGEPALAEACEWIARDAGHASLDAWSGGSADAAARRTLVRGEAVRLMERDAKSTGLKQLQGLIWQAGFESGQMRAHVYDDVPAALAAWNRQGKDVRIYSSGSVQAQKLFFGHTVHGNLLPHFRGHYDTRTGPKREAASYTAIASQYHLPPGDILFVSDVTAELDAARQAGMQTALCVRPGNAESPAGHGHATMASLAEIRMVSKKSRGA
jgi:enolase-phosphatase E1